MILKLSSITSMQGTAGSFLFAVTECGMLVRAPNATGSTAHERLDWKVLPNPEIATEEEQQEKDETAEALEDAKEQIMDLKAKLKATQKSERALQNQVNELTPVSEKPKKKAEPEAAQEPEQTEGTEQQETESDT